eukprot:scaffold23644_cov183-Amphora_coffeaeformis.AAC.2
MFETIFVHVSKEAGISSVVEILGAHGDFKVLGDVNAERSPVRHPRNASFVLRSREDVVDLLREGHIPNVMNGRFISLFWRNVSEISI